MLVRSPLTVPAVHTPLGASFHLLAARNLNGVARALCELGIAAAAPPPSPESLTDACPRYCSSSRRHTGGSGLSRRRCTVTRSRSRAIRSTLGHSSSVRRGVICSRRLQLFTIRAPKLIIFSTRLRCVASQSSRTVAQHICI